MHIDHSQNRNRLEDERAVRAALDPSEEIIWWGRPKQGVILRAGDALMIPFSFMWGGFALFWEYEVVSSGGPLIMMLWGLPFVAIGLYMIIGRFFVDSRIRAKTYYALTRDDAVVISGLFSRNTKRIGLKTLADISLTEKGDRSGTITLGPSSMFRNLRTPGWQSGSRSQTSPAFDMIPNAREVYNMIQAARSSS